MVFSFTYLFYIKSCYQICKVPATKNCHLIFIHISLGSIIATGSNDEKLIKVWSVEECECVNTIKLKADSVNCILIYVKYIFL